MAKPKMKYKVIRQSDAVGARFYGVIDNADPVVAELTMQQIIEYKKLYNYSPKQLAIMVEDVLQGAAELVARDGLARNVSSLLKFEARIAGTFANTESGISDQKIYVKPRMLKDIKVNIDKGNFSFENATASTAPKISGLALESDQFTGWNVDAFKKNGDTNNHFFIAPLTLSGVRLCPDGWSSDCAIAVGAIKPEGTIYRFDRRVFSNADPTIDNESGTLTVTPTVASDNVLKFVVSNVTSEVWQGKNTLPIGSGDNPVDFLFRVDTEFTMRNYVPAVGDRIFVAFRRQLADGSGSFVEAYKEVTLV